MNENLTLPEGASGEAILDKAIEQGLITQEEASLARMILKGEDNVVLEGGLVEEKVVPQEKAITTNVSEDDRDIRTRLADMKIPEKIKLAMFGNQICRAILVKDPNKMIQMFVLKNPKLTAAEVEDFVKDRNMSDVVLRAIGDSRTWMKSYNVKYRLVTNPKTPGDIALKWLKFLDHVDLKEIARSKGIPQLIVTSARKKVQAMEIKQNG